MKENPGAAVVAAIVAEMAEVGCVPTANEQAVLEAFRTLVIRMAQLDAVIERDGVLMTSPSGRVSAHPALVEFRQCVSTLPRLLGSVVIGNSAEGPNPVKSRAAMTRWQGAQARG